jgi:hypothetical protein
LWQIIIIPKDWHLGGLLGESFKLPMIAIKIFLRKEHLLIDSGNWFSVGIILLHPMLQYGSLLITNRKWFYLNLYNYNLSSKTKFLNSLGGGLSASDTALMSKTKKITFTINWMISKYIID